MYMPVQRHANKNLNGMVKQYFPNSSEFRLITKQRVEILVEKLNSIPGKRHQFYSSNEVYLQI